MMIFTKFGIWENEVREFINETAAKTGISKENLTQWFYTEGVMTFVLTQTAAATRDEEVYEKEHHHLPENISAELMSRYKKQGFQALQSVLLKKFEDNVLLKPYLQSCFNSFVENTVNQHNYFYPIQAAIKNSLNKYLNSTHETSLASKIQFIVNEYEKYKRDNPDLMIKINDDILLITEFMRAMQQQTIPSQQAMHSHISFKTSPARAEHHVDVVETNCEQPHPFLCSKL